MNPLIWFITLARSAGLAVGPKLGAIFNNLANLAEAGVDINAHMKAVEAKLKALHAAGASIEDADWKAVEAGIKSGSDRLQGS